MSFTLHINPFYGLSDSGSEGLNGLLKIIQQEAGSPCWGRYNESLRMTNTQCQLLKSEGNRGKMARKTTSLFKAE